ncbi:Mitochondrial inner membrane protein COX18 [Paramyrothecium foliicola]|nr:Mitochondrial inner membrane protein COX18 [Paramyrothecium foliicola]
MASLTRKAPAAFAPHSRLLHRPSLAASRKGITSRRNFHIGAAAGDVVRWTAEGLSSLHGMGLPWYLCIPLTAVCVNFTLRLPLQYYTRRLVFKQIELNPLVTAWASRHQAATPKTEPRFEGMRDMRIAGKIEKSRSRIYKAWGVQRWKVWTPLLGLFPFVLVSESLRRLSGAPVGALSQTLGFNNARASPSDSADSSGLFDASLEQGGGLWFTDLTVMDPYFALPVLCSAILARNSWFRMPTERLRSLLSLDSPNAPEPPIAKIRKAFGRALLAVPFFPLIFADMPSAIFLYWATAFSLTQVNELILDKWFLLPKKTVEKRPPVRQVLPFLRGRSVDPVHKK